ncbi:MAG: hypothetical protein WAO08_05900, partial [Hyphomicrobiaceae bacterium]
PCHANGLGTVDLPPIGGPFQISLGTMRSAKSGPRQSRLSACWVALSQRYYLGARSHNRDILADNCLPRSLAWRLP